MINFWEVFKVVDIRRVFFDTHVARLEKYPKNSPMTSYQNFKVNRVKSDQIHLTKATSSSSHIGIATNDDVVIVGREQDSITGDAVKPYVQLDVPIRINNGAIFDQENQKLTDPTGKFPGCVRLLNLHFGGGDELHLDGNNNLIRNVSGRMHKKNIVPIEEEETIDWKELVPKRFNYKDSPKIGLGLIADDVFEVTGIEDTIMRNKKGQIHNYHNRALISLMARELGRLQERISGLEGI